LFSSRAFGHFASTGSFLWIDPGKDLFVVVLTNGPQRDEIPSPAQRQILESIMSEL
jgi:CubicO group peptidase (beta-lactamase class C family)